MIQKLSYKMTHLYYNWNGTVRVPAPCQVSIISEYSEERTREYFETILILCFQYAHKLAYLVGEHMHAPATENLRNVLFFL